MLEKRQIAVIEGKCHRFRNSLEGLKTRCAATFDQFGRKMCQKKHKDVDYKLK